MTFPRWIPPLCMVALLGVAASSRAQSPSAPIPDWCRALPRPEYKTLKRVPLADSWFEVYSVAPGVFAIYEPHQAEETIGYLILGKTRALQFDTGMGIGDLKALTARLTKLPIVVLNSHTHNDHVGSNWQFSTVYGMDTDFTRADARGSRAAAQAELKPDEICGALPPGFDAKAYSTRPWHISRFLHDGDTIELGGRTLQVIATPGHTPDSICLLDSANGLLFTGDTYYPGTIWLYRPETNLSDYARSIHHLAALAPQLKMLLPAHNVPLADPAVLPQVAQAFERIRAQRVRPAPDGPGKAIYRVGGISFLLAAPQ